MLGKIALGKYRLLHLLGSGSNGAVYLAEPLQNSQQRVVVKRVHDHAAAHPKFRQLFEAEVRSMANFIHPYAVRLLDAALDDPLGPCLVMEYVPGNTLEDVLAVEKVLEPERAGRLLGYFCQALQAAHEAGIIHRDLKPANLMVVNAGQPNESIKVMDFGFAGFAARPHIQLAELTGHGPIYALGTPAYVSPEMVRGDPVDARSDLYSVGVILFEMLTGRLPFNYDQQDHLLAAHVREAPPRFHRIGCGHVPPEAEAVVQLALSKYPNERQQSACEIVEEFGRSFGENWWEQTQPIPGSWCDAQPPAVVLHDAQPHLAPLSKSTDPYRVGDAFEVSLPERLAAAKLRGFVEDFGGEVLSSEPGVILMRLGTPPNYKSHSPRNNGFLGWFTGSRKPTVPAGQEPIEVELYMEKPDPSLTRLRVSVACRPLRDFLPQNLDSWRGRCDRLQATCANTSASDDDRRG